MDAIMTNANRTSLGQELRDTLGQIVLVLQGGGALGAYQVGVYQALHEAGVEPDWVIGTSIGAINASLIAGNPVERRLDRMLAFWSQMEHSDWQTLLARWPGVGSFMANWMTMSRGVQGSSIPTRSPLPATMRRSIRKRPATTTRRRCATR